MYRYRFLRAIAFAALARMRAAGEARCQVLATPAPPEVRDNGPRFSQQTPRRADSVERSPVAWDVLATDQLWMRGALQNPANDGAGVNQSHVFTACIGVRKRFVSATKRCR
jgi:hypothetical protein